RLAGGHVRRTADDRPLAVAGVHLADAQLVCVGVLLDGEDLAHHEGVRRWSSDMTDPLDLDAVHGNLVRQLLDGELRVAVGTQPGDRRPQRNCSMTRTSFSKNLRRSGTPYLSMAIRSIPIPNANPCISSGS